MTSARALISRLEDIADPAAAAEVGRFYRGGDPATGGRCSSSTCGGTIGSTTGIWWTAPRRMWWGSSW